MIQNRVAFFWHATTISWLRSWTLRSFRACNPEVEMLICVPTDPCKLCDRNDTSPGTIRLRDVADEVQAKIVPWEMPLSHLLPHHASDFMQWEYLTNFSGWYSDMDIIFVNPLPSIDADAVFCLAGNGSIFTIGFLGSSGNNPIYADIYYSSRVMYGTYAYDATGAWSVYNAAKIEAITDRRVAKNTVSYFTHKYPDLKILVLPDEAMYKYTSQEIFLESRSVPDDAIGIHWYGGALDGKVWNELLSEDNWTNYDNTIITAIRKVRKA